MLVYYLLAGKGAYAGDGLVIRAGERATRVGQNIWCCLILWLILKYKDIIKMSSNPMEVYLLYQRVCLSIAAMASKKD